MSFVSRNSTSILEESQLAMGDYTSLRLYQEASVTRVS